MVFFNYALRKLNAKIVYYGPGLCGKTTNLQWIHDHFEGGQRGKMLSLATEGDRTIFFDLLPLDIGTIRGMQVTLQLYTVPGQVHYNSTRQLVLRGADGVVFVADSQRTMESSNVESLKNLEENLALQGVELKGFPCALQFNKRDLGDLLSIEEMDNALNWYSVPIFEAVATDGVGVQETLEGIVKLVMRNLRERYEPVAAAGGRLPGRPSIPATWGGRPIASKPAAPAAPRPVAAPAAPVAARPAAAPAPPVAARPATPVAPKPPTAPVTPVAPTRPREPVIPAAAAAPAAPFEPERLDIPSPDITMPTAFGLDLFGGKTVEARFPDDVPTAVYGDRDQDEDGQGGVFTKDEITETSLSSTDEVNVASEPGLDVVPATEDELALGGGEIEPESDAFEVMEPDRRGFGFEPDGAEPEPEPAFDLGDEPEIEEPAFSEPAGAAPGAADEPSFGEVVGGAFGPVGDSQPVRPVVPPTPWDGPSPFGDEVAAEPVPPPVSALRRTPAQRYEDQIRAPGPFAPLSQPPPVSEPELTEPSVEPGPGFFEEPEPTDQGPAFEPELAVGDNAFDMGEPVAAEPALDEAERAAPRSPTADEVFADEPTPTSPIGGPPAAEEESPFGGAFEESADSSESEDPFSDLLAGLGGSVEAVSAPEEPALPEPRAEFELEPGFGEEPEVEPVVFPEVEGSLPSGALAVTPQVTSVRRGDKENQLRVQLSGTGALAEYGEVREMDIIVPVPGEWVGHRRVTLQLRLTLAPATEEADDGHSDAS